VAALFPARSPKCPAGGRFTSRGGARPGRGPQRRDPAAGEGV